MSMKKIVPIIMCLLFVLVGCTNKNSNVDWKFYTSQDKSYTLEIPSDFVLNSNEIGGWMAFTKKTKNSSDAAFIVIRPVSNGFSSFDEDLLKNDQFQYTVYNESANSKFAECNKGMWSAVQLGMIKNIDGTQYLITLNSQKSRSLSEKIIKHIYDSMVEDTPNTSERSQDDSEDEFAKYSTPYFSISYPKNWLMIKNPDQMSDVYIGTEDESLGFTIVRFDTDATFDEIIEEAKNGSVLSGMKITSNKIITLNGMSCNRMVNEYQYNGIPIKTIAYTFKQGDTLYSIKFGSQKKYVDRNKVLIENIMNSLKLK